MSCPDQPACCAGVLRRNACKELHSASNSALDALEALSRLHAGIHEQAPHRQEPGLSFALLKKHCLQLSVQAHKCTRLQAMICGRDDAALRSVLVGQLQQLSRILDDTPRPDGTPLFRRLAGGWQNSADAYMQQCSGPADWLRCSSLSPAFIIGKEAGLFFFHAAGLFPRINHCLQQLDRHSWVSLAAVSTRIQRLIMDCPLPDQCKAGLARELHHLFLLQKNATLSLVPRVHSEDGSRSSFAGLVPVLKQINWHKPGTVEQAYKQILSSLYAPQALAYMEARGLRHEYTRISVLCIPENAIPATPNRGWGGQGTTVHAHQTPWIATGAMDRQQHTQPPGALLKGCPGGAGIAAGRVCILHHPADASSAGGHCVAVVPKASMDWVWLLPRIAALIVEERAESSGGPHPLLRLAREFDLPVICGLADAGSMLQEGTPVTVDAIHGVVHTGIIRRLVQSAPARSRSTLASPAEKSLTALCQLTGAVPCSHPVADTGLQPFPLCSMGPAGGGPTSLDLILTCRLRALQALLEQTTPGAVLHLAPALRYTLYDMDGAPSTNGSDQIPDMKNVATPLLRPLWRGMTQQAAMSADRLAALNPSELKNSVLLGGKYCTVQIVCANFLLYLGADENDHGQTLHLVLLLHDSRAGATNRIRQIARRLAKHNLKVQAAGGSLRVIAIRTRHQQYQHDLHLLGAVTVQALA